MGVTKKTVGAVLRSGLPAVVYVQDFETQRCIEAIYTALRLLGNILDGEDPSVRIDIPPDVELDEGPNVQITRRGRNWFKISARFVSVGGDGPPRGTGGGVNFLFELGDVSLTSLASGQVLKYDGTKWVNGSGGNPTDFQFTQTSTTGGTISFGNIMLKGTFLTALTNWTNYASGADLTLASVTSTTYYWIAIDLSAATASWNSSTTAWGTANATTLIYKILTLTCADSVITAVKQHQAGALNVPGNV